jgi:hypothetical protein
MSSRITFLVLCLLCLFSLAAAAASAPPNPATPSGPDSRAVASAPAADLSWLLQPGAPSTSQEPAANALFGATPAVTCTKCICQCIQAGGDSICCAYVCHPIGMNPC